MSEKSVRWSGRSAWMRRIVVTVVAALGLSVMSLASPQSASAASVVVGFDSVVVAANPNAWAITGIANTINGSTAGLDYGRIFTAQQPATGVVVDYSFATPKYQVTGLRLYNNGGGVLTDADGIGTALVEVFDSSNTLLFSGPLTAGNGGGVFLTSFSGPLDGVARVRLSNITNLLPGAGAAPDIIWRELQAVQNVSTPALATQINADGYSDDVTITGTEGLDGTLDWSLYGPVAPGPGDSCVGVSWVGAAVFASGSLPVAGDGVLVTTPPAAPSASGCYSYADTLAGPSYTASAVSLVGQTAETFFVAPAPDPSLSLVKSALPNDAASFTLNQVITYSFVVQNTGNVPLTAVTVTESSFSGSGPMGAITCPGGNGSVSLAVSEQVTCTATYTVTQDDVNAGILDNSATASGTPPTGPPVTSPVSSTAVPGDPSPELSLLKSVSPQTGTAAGDTVTYSFLITNTGNVTLSDVTATEETFSGSGALAAPTCPADATLLPGEQLTCTAEYTLTQADVDAGTVANSAVAGGTPPTGPDVASASSNATIDIVATPAIALVKSADPTVVTAAGQTVTYDFVISNTGNVTLSGLGVNETAFTGDGALSAVECPATAPLAPGDDVTCTATYFVTQVDIDNGGSFGNTATATGLPPAGPALESAPSSASVAVDAASRIGLAKVAQSVDANANGRTDPGDLVSWDITVSNLGATTLSDVVVTDPTAGSVTCPSTVLAPGASMTCTVAARVVTTADASAGGITNAAAVSASGPDGVVVAADAQATIAVAQSGLALTGAGGIGTAASVGLLLVLVGIAVGPLHRRRLQRDSHPSR